MIVVATADFEVYHDVVHELRERQVPFTTVEPGDELPPETRAVITGADDDVAVGPDVVRVVAEPDAPRRAVEAALTRLREGDGRTVVGVDPGTRPGIAVLAGDTVVAAYQVGLSEAADVVRDELAGALDPVVRVGDGSRLEGARLVEALDDVRVELVDETGTTPHLGRGARGMGDVLAAVNIAAREGEEVDSLALEPTAGEIQVIQDRSRERTRDNRALSETLARRVATGDLTLEEAIDRHREATGDPEDA
ncbi:MAG: hypothetical protein ABEJ70_02760 [Halobacteriaceae archaeon]